MGKDITSISETYVLPSKGKVNNIQEEVTIRSMTTMEEKKRLGNSEVPFKLLSDIINDCVTSPKQFNSYDLPIGDFQFLLHKLRIVTYGKMYPVALICPSCGKVVEQNVDLDSLEVLEYEEGMEDIEIELPRSQDVIKVNLLTPKIIDRITRRANELTSKSDDYVGSPTLLFTLQELIDTVNGEKLPPAKLEKYVQTMLAADSRHLQKESSKIKLGVNTRLKAKCNHCKTEFDYDLPINAEFL